MNQECCRCLSVLPLVLLLVLGWSAYLPTSGLATELPVYGGSGGNPFRAECPKGSYLVGLAGSSGSWVNRIAPICAPWLRGSQTFGGSVVGQSFGASGGGQALQMSCWGSGPNNSVVQSWHIETLKSDNRFVQYIGVACISLKPSPVLTSAPFFEFGSRPVGDELLTAGPYISDRAHSESCPTSPTREIAVGIHGRAGLFVDAVGLICGPVPPGFGAPVAKLPGPLTQAPSSVTPMKPITKNLMIPDDMFVITRPVPGDRVPQGQLTITATAPKVGTTNVTELELKYLDAPPNQANSYPYTTAFSVDTATLLQGYSVDPIVAGYNGRWQVRARSSMKAVPGPWSVPVQFQMVKTQPPPPMVQMSKPNAPITQTPAPNTGTAPMMVRPRGVNENAGKEDNQAVDSSPEAEKKP